MHAVTALARKIEGDPGDPADFLGVVDLGVDAPALAVGQVGDAARLAEVDPAGQLAHDHDVEAGYELFLQRRCFGQRVKTDRRAQVGEQLEILAQAQQAALGAQREIERIVLRATHRTEQHTIGGEGLVHDRVGDRGAIGVVGGTANLILGDVDLEATVVAEPVDHAPDFGHHFLPDAITGEHENILRHRQRPLFSYNFCCVPV
ncbi:MAG: Uncharacterised protein [Rhodospirillaceae bacterium]|nr:MAG: Uncharacterised protein [Rhodospirillaceae bacterium]